MNNKKRKPLWITGFFRSGTSVTAEILMRMGIDLGPSSHLLQPIGQRKKLNPNGFFENYLFMDYSLWIFYILNSWGDSPPPESAIECFYLDKLNYKKFVYFSLVKIHDDRISNWNKMRILRKYHPLNIDEYLDQEFKDPFAVKNVHFSVLLPILLRRWPHSRFLVVFRNPDAAVISMKRGIVQTAGYELYIEYYSRLINKEGLDMAYFSYDHLIRHPEFSIRKLTEKFELGYGKINEALQSVKPELNRNDCEMKKDLWPYSLKELYAAMLGKAINVP